MPEGPSIVLLKEKAEPFSGKKIIGVYGNSTIDMDRLLNSTVERFSSWGKQFLICFNDFTLRVHFLMWGSYLINEKKDRPVRLNLTFENGEINFYSCSIKIMEGKADHLYDFSSDVMSDTWDARKAKKKARGHNEELICDVLLDQDIFSGVGNIIKNEVLYRTHVQPESVTGNIPDPKLRELVKEARNYSFQFYEWKKIYELKKHWLAHNKKICPRCNIPFTRKHTGRRDRRSFFCTNCQRLY